MNLLIHYLVTIKKAITAKIPIEQVKIAEEQEQYKEEKQEPDESQKEKKPKTYQDYVTKIHNAKNQIRDHKITITAHKKQIESAEGENKKSDMKLNAYRIDFNKTKNKQTKESIKTKIAEENEKIKKNNETIAILKSSVTNLLNREQELREKIT